ncbi:hypothetical protein O181_025364 [Austropuccinia psidii MF-1]|uniref:Integrase catalytic domain-containing protein n=1 Tax=Austropuccinia psidii MF-1 TaxID=1389203 RepID=A0A9Q3H0K0_9BASI|nr:hypothetical protein [Austropuccinia psidii MF-1]
MTCISSLTYGTESTGCDKSSLKAPGEGTAKLMDKNGKIWSLKNCLYVPDLMTNLVALSQLAKQITIKNEDNNYKVFLNNANMPAFTCATNSGILETCVTLPRSRSLYTTDKKWQNRLGHMHEEGIRRLIMSFRKKEVCEICTRGKFPKLPFQHNFQQAAQPLENIHLDICGPIQSASFGGAKYFMIIVDQYTGYINIKFLKLKNDVYLHFRNFKEQAENKQQRKIQNITTDRGGEFVSKNFKSLRDKCGINHTISTPYTPQHNGIAERGKCLIIEKTCCLLLQSKLPPQF